MILATLAFGFLLGHNSPLQISVQEPEVGTRLSRSLALLRSGAAIHILFYGQSITRQDWTRYLIDDLKSRFPKANIWSENLAIGGFASDLLKKTAEHDLYPAYADLVIFHDYGGEPDYEGIILKLRRTTTSEVILQSDHVDWMPKNDGSDSAEAVHRYEWHNRHAAWLRSLADRCGYDFVDIRGRWFQRLTQESRVPREALIDGIHLNELGNRWMAQFISTRLPTESASIKLPRLLTLVSEIPLTPRASQRSVRIAFSGNRISLIANGMPIDVEIKIDGKRPSQISGLYSISRPSDGPMSGIPAITLVTADRPLVAEEWSATVLDNVSLTAPFRFKIQGSKTGPDGDGVSDQPFRSQSGRVIIDPANWFLKSALQTYGAKTGQGSVVTWKVKGLFLDSLKTNVKGKYLLAQGLTNGPHILELHGTQRQGIEGLEINRPPVTE